MTQIQPITSNNSSTLTNNNNTTAVQVGKRIKQNHLEKIIILT